MDTSYCGLSGGGVIRGELGEGTKVECTMSTLQRGTAKLERCPGSNLPPTGKLA